MTSWSCGGIIAGSVRPRMPGSGGGAPLHSERESAAPIFHQLEVDATAMQFGEVGIDRADLSLQLHPHRHDDIAGQQRRVPELALVGALALLPLRSATDMAGHPAGDRVPFE